METILPRIDTSRPRFRLASNVKAITAGLYHACAHTGSQVQCWGSNTAGRLGDNTNTARGIPTTVSGINGGVQQVRAGATHTCAIINGGAKCWGGNDLGQLGINSSDASNHPYPTTVSGASSGMTSVIGGYWQSCTRSAAGGLRCAGSNTNGNIGDNATNGAADVPIAASVYGGTQSIDLFTSLGETNCAIIAGSVKCWGLNNYNQLGINSAPATSVVPITIYPFGP